MHLLHPSRDGDFTISLGSLFHCSAIFLEKKFFQISTLSRHNQNPFPLILSLFCLEEETGTLLSGSHRKQVGFFGLNANNNIPPLPTEPQSFGQGWHTQLRDLALAGHGKIKNIQGSLNVSFWWIIYTVLSAFIPTCQKASR